MRVCVTNLESRGWERREWGDKSVCVYERERVGDGRECESVRESRGWQRESTRWERQSERMGEIE